MKPKTLILMLVAIGCGLVASYMTSRVIAERNTDKGEEEKVSVLVAKQNLVTGYLIKEPEQVFEEKQFTKGEEPKKAVRSYEELKDHRLNKPLTAEQFVTAEDLMSKEQESISALMQKGMRAVGVKVTVEAQVAGFVLPQCRVDIICVVKQNEELYSKIILQNVLVLALDQTQTRPDDKPAMVAATVVVQVTPAQAEALSLAAELGTLRLILRPFGDEEKTRTAGAFPRSLQGGNNGSAEDGLQGDGDAPPRRAPVAPKVKPNEQPPLKQHMLTIYNGDAVTREFFLLNEQNVVVQSRIERGQPESAPTAKVAFNRQR